MNRKEFQLDLEATLSEAFFGHGYAHYGYWPEGMPEVPSAQALGEAQQAYFDLIASTIPEGTRTILDVGSGTGANALGLIRLGYRLECICPSEQMNALARRKLPEEVEIHTLTFEEFETDRRYDMALFAESFHYIDLQAALAQLERFIDGHVLIFDYFRREGRGEGGTRGTHRAFVEAVERQGVFTVIRDEDKTEAIVPTFAVIDHLKAEHIAPFIRRTRAAFAQSHPLRSWLVNRIAGRVLDRMARPGRRGTSFRKEREYRLILMKRN